MTARRVIYAVLALALIVVGADTACWKWAADRMRQEIKAWVDDRDAEGWRITMAKPMVSGWPLMVTGYLKDVSIRQKGAAAQAVGVQLPDVTLAVRLLQPTSVVVTFGGEQTVKLGDAPALQVAGASLVAEIPLPDPSGRAVRLIGRDLRLRPQDNAWTARVVSLDGHIVVENPGAPVAFALQAEGVDLPDKINWPLGAKVASAAVSGTLNGSLPPLYPTASWASAWRDGGGSVDIKAASVEWGPLTLTSTATLALDDQLQPMGSGSAKASGYMEALDRMAKAGLLTRSAATVAKAMLSLLAGTGNGDAPPEVEVPLTLQYRTLSMRQVPLVRFPELDWPPP